MNAPKLYVADVEPWEGIEPRKWQARALPPVLKAYASGTRGAVRAVTGAGKSYFIAEICRVLGDARIVVTTPTEKLVNDLAKTIRARTGDVGKFYGRTKNVRRVTVVCNPSLPAFAAQHDPPDLILVDEAHESECATFLDTFEDWHPDRILGLTATPWRADKGERLTLFDRLLYDYGPQDAIRDGVVVPPMLVHPRPEDGHTLDEVCRAMIMRESGPGIVDATSIKDAQAFNDVLRDAGVNSTVVHSRMGADTVERRIKQLEAGNLDVIVHVSMLSRGVDIPCLRWLCCRRPIGSRTLFAQYIGRGIRSYEGKTNCRVLDPHDLFNRHSLSYEAVLGAGEGGDLDIVLGALKLDEIIEDLNDGDGEDARTLEGVPIRVLDPAAAYVRALRHTLEVTGVIPFDANPGLWRNDPIEDRDLDRLYDRIGVIDEIEIPGEHRRALLIAYKAVRSQKRGDASDLLRVLKVLDWRGWCPELDEVTT